MSKHTKLQKERERWEGDKGMGEKKQAQRKKERNKERGMGKQERCWQHHHFLFFPSFKMLSPHC